MKKNHSLRLVEMADDQVRRLRDYGSTARERKAAREELSNRQILTQLSDEAIRATIEICEDEDTRIRARREWQRRQAKTQAREVEHATAS